MPQGSARSPARSCKRNQAAHARICVSRDAEVAPFSLSAPVCIFRFESGRARVNLHAAVLMTWRKHEAHRCQLVSRQFVVLQTSAWHCRHQPPAVLPMELPEPAINLYSLPRFVISLCTISTEPKPRPEQLTKTATPVQNDVKAWQETAEEPARQHGRSQSSVEVEQSAS